MIFHRISSKDPITTIHLQPT